MVVSDRPLKRAKRRITAGLLDFLAFPSPSLDGDRIHDGPFRSNVKRFLSEYARVPPSPTALIFSPSALTTWRVSFRIGDGDDVDEIVEMDVIEEEVSRSRIVYCDQCRVVGWSGHPVCKKRYHFIIRNSNNLLSGYNQMCRRCGSLLHMLNSRCPSCNYEITAEDFEDWAYRQLEDSTHLLHGVIHANGYGHLLRVNGREGGSKYLSGTDIMGFWDRLCKMLQVRKVTVMDMSKKHGMDYRLLHAVCTGHPWYGEWGYEFGAGSFSITSDAYKKAVDMLSNIPLSIIFSHSRSPHTSLHDTISFYWSLSDCKIETIRDLFVYLTTLLHESHRVQPPSVKTGIGNKNDCAGVLCTWGKCDIEKAEESMVKVLKAVGVNRWVTWKALKGATCKAVASHELLDYCLRGLGGKICDDGLVVVVRCNPDSSAIEYRLEAVYNRQSEQFRNPIKPPVDILLRDLKLLYDNLLNPSTMHRYNPEGLQKSALSSAAKLLDCKQFVKNFVDHQDSALKIPNTISIWCDIELVNQPKNFIAPPELLILPTHANVADLKLQATKAFQETYLIFQKFQAEQIVGLGNVSDLTNLRLLLGENVSVKIRGRCFGDEYRLGRFRMERGLETWTVDCACGAKDDDGERMMACDTCGVWQHTRCSGISDRDAAPVKFICTKCIPKYCLKLNKSKGRGSKEDSCDSNVENGRCKDEASQSTSQIADASGSYGLMTSVG